MLSTHLSDRLTLPLIVAPMTGVSGVELVLAACRAGVIGSFPTHNASSSGVLDSWLHRIKAGLRRSGRPHAPFAPNLVVHRSNPRLAADLESLLRHRVEVVITSVGSPAPVVEPLRAAGCLVFADVATVRHADRAITAGVDDLVLLTAGAGGQTGTANPFAFVRAIRERFAGTIVLAGGISDGARYAQQSPSARTSRTWARSSSPRARASPATTSRLPSLRPASMTSHWASGPVGCRRVCCPVQHRIGPDIAPGEVRQQHLLAGLEVRSAGHSVGGVRHVAAVADIVDQTCAEYDARSPPCGPRGMIRLTR